MHVRNLGIIGLGAFGTFVKERAKAEAPWLEVHGWDLAGGSSASLERVLTKDAVIFAVPPKEYVPTLQKLVPHMRPDGIIVDVCTVKMVTVAALKEVANGRPYIATHPMFGRQSFVDQGNSLKGLQLVVCEHTLDKGLYPAVVRFLTERVGLTVVSMSAHEHDESQAREQLLTQYIGCVMKRTGFALNPHNIHTVSAKHFYRAMTIVGNDEELFRQASALNPHWPRVLAQYELADAQHRFELLNGSAK